MRVAFFIPYASMMFATMAALQDAALQSAIGSVRAGAWAVGVSGGADSVALLSLLRAREDLQLTVAHLDHETRAGASALDAAFVRELCDGWHLPCVCATLSSVEQKLPARPPKNLSARYRLARLAWFGQVVRSCKLEGVILAHHRDDQAETIFHRLLRGAPPSGLAGMAGGTTLCGVTVLRPLLAVPRLTLRQHLHVVGQPWREDASNASPHYARNRIRQLLAVRPALVEPLIELGERCRRLNSWIDALAPTLAARFRVSDVAALPKPLAHRALQRWLHSRYPEGGADAASAERLLEMALDAATSPRQHFPGGVLVCRRRGEIFVAADQ